ncbi:MAG: insulinase family protein [Acidobacteria bacterium]|nr:insulinase family protein [Acidobacteriota bacterium]
MSSPPPLPETIKNIRYPEVHERQLANGLRVLVVPDERLPKISIQLAFPAGRVSNPDHNLALVPMAVQLLREGTQNRSARQISDALDYWAIQFESKVAMEHTLLAMTALADYLEPMLDLLSDLVQNPAFPLEEIDRLRVRWRSKLAAQRSQPDFLANERVFHSLYPGHPYSKVTIPPPHLEQADQKSIRETLLRYFVPNDAYLLFAGPLDADLATRQAEKYFGGWPRQNFPALFYPSPRPQEHRPVCVVHRPDSVQSRISVAARTLPRAHPDSLIFSLANQVLGGSASARLFLNLREARGYTYGAYSLVKSYRYDGIFVASANVKMDVTIDSIQEFLKELERMTQQVPAQEELHRCQAELIGAFLRQTETAASVGNLELTRRIYQLPEDFYHTLIPTLRDIAAEQVHEISQNFFNPEKVLITVVADREAVEWPLSRFGKVLVYDSEGRKLSEGPN